MESKTRLIVLLLFLTLLHVSTSQASNHLVDETSPYLLQHKDNPVDWYPWGKEAFDKAKQEHKLIFLSIGYATCHWCHVMADESFENRKFATLLNKYFVSIKLDREEYPYIDAYYQKVYRSMHGVGGGWPLTIMMTAAKQPFYSASYMPLYSSSSFRGLSELVTMVIATPHKRLIRIGTKVLASLDKNENNLNLKASLHSNLASKTIKEILSYYDFTNSGFSKRPKFPEASKIILLLKLYEITNNRESLNMATSTLDAMAQAGIYDQIEGGFYRYSVDAKWQIPHFEKMLYTNGELLQAYALAYKHTKKPLYKKVIEETIAQMDKRFKVDNLYMSASNADSKNFSGDEKEGFYFLYSYDAVVQYLQKKGFKEEAIDPTLHYLGITEDGNFDGELSNPHITEKTPPKNLKKIKKLLVEMRQKKEYPFIDNKINTTWNAIYLKGVFKARIIDTKYIKEAKKSLDALIDKMYVKGVLYHQTIPGVLPKQKALLEDYAFLISTLFEAYQATLEQKYLYLYEQLIKKSITLFYKNGRWLESTDGFRTYAGIEERAYTNALAQESINILNYATVEADMKKYALVKDTMQNHANAINVNPSNYSTATLVSLMLEYGTVFIKSTKENLNLININEVKYPFVYKYVVDDTNKYLACKIKSCFSYDAKFKKVKKDIESLLSTH